MQEMETKILAAYRGMAESGKLDEIIRSNVEKTVQQKIADALSSYSPFGKALDEAVKQSLQIDTGRLGLPGYNQALLKICREVLDAEVEAVGAQRLKETLQKLLDGNTPREITLTELVAQFKESIRDDFETREYDGEITVILEPERHGFRSVYLDRTADCHKYSCAYQIGLHEKDGEVYSLVMRGKSPDRDRFIGDIHGFERTLFYMHAVRSKLVIDTEYPDLQMPERECEC